MGSLANSSSLQTTIQDEIRCRCLSAFSQLSLLTLKPSPRLRLMPTMAITTAMDWPTTGTDMAMLTMATMATLMLTMATTARDPLMRSPRLMLTMATTAMDWPTTDMDMDMDWLTMATTVLMLTLMLMATTTARGLLMLSLLLMPTMVITTAMLLTAMLTVATTATLMLTVATTVTDIITKLLLFCSRIEEFAICEMGCS